MKTVRRPPYPKWNPGYFPCSSLTPLPLSSRRPSVSFGGFGLSKKVGQLSVGQQRKLEIARLRVERPQILLLDEPTNYISLDVLDAFEEAIGDFPGSVVAVSHDRWFMQRFGGEVWELVGGSLIKGSVQLDVID